MKRTALRLVAGSFLTLGLALGVAQSAGAQDTSSTSLTVHHRLCGDNYDGGDPFTECHDVLLGTSFDFTIDGPVTQTAATDVSTGNVSFDNIPAGTYTLSGGVPGEFSTKNIYCSNSVTGEAVNVTGSDVEVPDGVAVVCDVYEFPEDLSGNTPTATATQTATATATATATSTATATATATATNPVTSLPNTGAGQNSGSDQALWLVIPAAMALGGLGFGVRRRAMR